ncbi:hypothetical protein AR687_24255 [Flavobacteriaceae bacterium CRH]|nr:hypothetical protein AR687_24255 [Flavobacteriaceae bacterium CRH]
MADATEPPPIPLVKIGDSLIRYNKKNLIVTLVKDYNPNDSNETKYSEKTYSDNFDSLTNIKTGQKIAKEDHYFVISLKDFKIDYKIIQGQLIEKQNNVKTIIDYLRFEDGNYLKILSLYEGELKSVDLVRSGGPLDTEGYCYNKEGDIDFLYDNYSDLYTKQGNDTTKYIKLDYTHYPLKKYFFSGSGFWKMYHYEHINPSYILEHNKEEGEIKNNFKYGEWKYYNKGGVIDSTKTYTLKDSVDVRFPHCIFNKKEL